MASLGNINNPLKTLNPDGGYRDVTSLPLFISNIVRIITMGAGIFVFVNILIAGIKYISAGSDEQKITEAGNSITMSVLGLAVIVGSFTLTGIISYVLYQDASIILKPTIYGPGSFTPTK